MNKAKTYKVKLTGPRTGPDGAFNTGDTISVSGPEAFRMGIKGQREPLSEKMEAQLTKEAKAAAQGAAVETATLQVDTSQVERAIAAAKAQVVAAEEEAKQKIAAAEAEARGIVQAAEAAAKESKTAADQEAQRILDDAKAAAAATLPATGEKAGA